MEVGYIHVRACMYIYIWMYIRGWCLSFFLCALSIWNLQSMPELCLAFALGEDGDCRELFSNNSATNLTHITSESSKAKQSDFHCYRYATSFHVPREFQFQPSSPPLAQLWPGQVGFLWGRSGVSSRVASPKFRECFDRRKHVSQRRKREKENELAG